MKTKATKAMVRELCTICTRNEAGQHFTETSKHWEALEKAGLIAIHRPVHTITGIAYSLDAWILEATEAGQAVVDASPELHRV